MNIFLFHRDLRLVDNTTLIHQIKEMGNIVPIFIFTPEQINSKKNSYFSNNSVQFMIESLHELSEEIKKKEGKIYFFKGDTMKVLKSLNKENNIESIGFNIDYTPYAKKRDGEIKDWCDKKNIICYMKEDYPLYDILNNIGDFKDYQKKRDTLIYKTTFLGAHNHFSTVSIREEYYAMLESLGKESGLINELHWRDFYMNTAYNFPDVLNGQIGKKNKSLKIKYDNIKWENNMKLFEHWKTATTGFPLIDASMRQLLQSGFVHNRMRMVSGSFVVKILLIDWRYAEKFYASHLVDYDTMVNNLSWQWVAGSGNDAQPYFRYFNTWTQSKKYDKNAEYIKKWIPELKEVPAIDLHNWFKKEIHEKWLNNGIKYYKPIVEHSEQRIKSLKMYKDGLN